MNKSNLDMHDVIAIRHVKSEQHQEQPNKSQREVGVLSVITGTADNDNLTGTSSPDQISCLDVDDWIEGEGPADVLDEGNCTDTLNYFCVTIST